MRPKTYLHSSFAMLRCYLLDSPAMVTRIPTTDSKHAWAILSPNTECNAGAGEVYRSQSPGVLPNIAACKKSCEDVAACKSITFFESGWCSHFSTGCTKTKPASKAISMRLGSASGSGHSDDLLLPKITVNQPSWSSTPPYFQFANHSTICLRAPL